MAGSFDVVVVGGGPGGYVAALRAAQLGANTAIVEKDRLGGTCLVRGCIPTKALLQSSELYTLAKGGAAFGLVADNIAFDWAAAQKRKTAVVDQLVKGVEGLLKAGGGTIIHGSGKLAGGGAAEVAKVGGALQVRFSSGGEGGGAVDADQVLLAVGRSPYTEGLGAEAAGVKLDRGRVVVDDHLRSTAQGVWAIGDVIGGIMLAHVASYEGICAVENIAGHARIPDYHAAPNCVYTDPEIAHVGLGEKEATERGIEVKVGRFPFAAAGRALTLGQTEGFVKVVADAPTGRVLGVHIVGPRATDLIPQATLAVQNGLTLNQLDLTMHAHPTLPEAIMEAALAAQGRAIHIPNRRAASNPSPTPTATATATTVALHNREPQMV